MRRTAPPAPRAVRSARNHGPHAGAAARAGRKPHDLAQPPPHPVALDRIADLLRHGKSDANRAVARHGRAPAPRKPWPTPVRPPRRPENRLRRLNRSMDNTASGGRRSRTEPLAALRAPGRDHLAAALGRHPGAETVSALAHQFARLIGPFHGILLRSPDAPPPVIASISHNFCACAPARKRIGARLARLIREPCLPVNAGPASAAKPSGACRICKMARPGELPVRPIRRPFVSSFHDTPYDFAANICQRQRVNGR